MAGETVNQAGATSPAFSPIGSLLAGKPLKFEVTTAQIETADLHLVGYVPAGVTFVGYLLKTDDLDTGSEEMIFDVLVGATTFDSGVTIAQATAGIIGTGDFITTTAETAIYLKIATDAATAAAGTVNFLPLYVGA